MTIERKDVENIAHLARLQLDSDEVAEVAGSLANILSLIDEMQSVSTGNVPPLSHPFDVTQRLRDDVVSEQNQRDELQQIAPKVEKGLFLVPKVIE